MTRDPSLAPVAPPGLDDLPTKAAKIRALAQAGFARSEIARRLSIRYQHVRNVLERDAASTRSGMAEEQAPYVVERLAKLRVGPDGRVVIPAPFRQLMGLRPDSVVLARMEGDELRLFTPDSALRRIQDEVAALVPPGVSLVDDLIAERRAEADRE